jgi:hypothetical protein
VAEERPDFIRAACGGCGKALRVPANLAGRTVKCPQCGTPFQVPAAAPSEAPPEAPPARPPVARPAPARPAPVGPRVPPAPARTATRSRLRSRSRAAAPEDAGQEGGREGATLWKRIPWWIKWPAGIVLVIVCGYITVSLDEDTLKREQAICRTRAIGTLAEGSQDPALVRFLIDKFHEDCCGAAMTSVHVTLRSKRKSCDLEAYLQAMKRRVEAELANPNSTLVKEFRAQKGS